MAQTIPLIKIFLSSPNDMKKEREIAISYVEEIRNSPFIRKKALIQIISWDKPQYGTVMVANLNPQEAINQELPQPSECDIVLVFFGSRMGTPFLHTDGKEYPSGTYWELLDALSSQTTDTVIYRKVNQESIDDKAQYKLVQDFFDSDIFYKDGKILRSVHQYKTLEEFRDLIKEHLVQLIEKKINHNSQSNSLEELIDSKSFNQIKRKMMDLIQQTYVRFNNHEFYTICQPLRQSVDNRNHNGTWKPVIELYEKTMQSALQEFITLAYYGDENILFLVKEALKNWTRVEDEKWKHSQIRYTPNWLLIYCVGISAISRPDSINWNYIQAIFYGEKVKLSSMDIWVEAWIDTVVNLFSLNSMSFIFPSNELSKMTYDILRPLFMSDIPHDEDFESYFIQFESLLSFLMWHRIRLNGLRSIFMPLRKPCYTFFDKGYEIAQLEKFWSNIGELGKNWILLNLFNDDIDNLIKRLQEYSSLFSPEGMCNPVKIVDFYLAGYNNKKY